jgi:hypothetical protein
MEDIHEGLEVTESDVLERLNREVRAIIREARRYQLFKGMVQEGLGPYLQGGTRWT